MRTSYQEHVADIKVSGAWRLIGLPLIIAIIVFAVFPGIFGQGFAALLGMDPAQAVTLASALGMAVTLLLGIPLMLKGSNLKLVDLGLSGKGAVSGAIIGVLWGIGMLAVVALILNLIGAVHTGASPKVIPGVILTGLFFFILQGTWEELVYRAYLMPHFTKMMGAPVAIVVTSLLFTLGHALNPGMKFMPILNLFLASLVFSLYYYRTGSLWKVGLAHGIWNFSQGYIFGSQVSGNVVKGSLLVSPPAQNMNLLSGGSFGFEGSIITSLTAVVLIVILSIKCFGKKSQKETAAK